MGSASGSPEPTGSSDARDSAHSTGSPALTVTAADLPDSSGSPDAPGLRRRLLVATRSRHKLRELGELLALGPGVELLSPDDVGIEDEPEETGETFETNARIKARFYARRAGIPTLADDSGIEVDALGGAPGVRTRRFSGPDATDARNNEKLLRELEGLPPERRGARYVCVLALALPGGAERAAMTERAGDTAQVRRPERRGQAGGPERPGQAEPERQGPGAALPIIVRRGTCRGRIADAPRGAGGFGYDPIFEPAQEPPGGRTLGQWTAAEKHAISHRSRAAARMLPVLRELGLGG